MTYKDLLVHVDESRGCARRVELAVELAAAHDAHLTGVTIVSEPSPASFVHPYLPPDLTATLQQELRARADAALARFAEVARRNQIAFETRVDRVLYTDIAEALATNARYADLVILGQFDPDDPAAGPRYLPEQVVLGCGRPALVVPYIGPAPTFGERAIVAWDASREAARAVNDALPLLERAKAVSVVSVNPAVRPWRGAGGRHRSASRAPRPQGRGRAHRGARAGRGQRDPLASRQPRRGPPGDGRLWPFADARVRARGRHPDDPRRDDRAGADVALRGRPRRSRASLGRELRCRRLQPWRKPSATC
jgi:nucleotide-binding universal stress UspA family protein